MIATRSIRTGQSKAGRIGSGLALAVLHDEIDRRDRLDALDVLVLGVVRLGGRRELVLVLVVVLGLGVRKRVLVHKVLVDELVRRAAGGRLDVRGQLLERRRSHVDGVLLALGLSDRLFVGLRNRLFLSLSDRLLVGLRDRLFLSVSDRLLFSLSDRLLFSVRNRLVLSPQNRLLLKLGNRLSLQNRLLLGLGNRLPLRHRRECRAGLRDRYARDLRRCPLGR